MCVLGGGGGIRSNTEGKLLRQVVVRRLSLLLPLGVPPTPAPVMPHTKSLPREIWRVLSTTDDATAMIASKHPTTSRPQHGLGHRPVQTHRGTVTYTRPQDPKMHPSPTLPKCSAPSSFASRLSSSANAHSTKLRGTQRHGTTEPGPEAPYGPLFPEKPCRF